jgi:hypothetical protein
MCRELEKPEFRQERERDERKSGEIMVLAGSPL